MTTNLEHTSADTGSKAMTKATWIKGLYILVFLVASYVTIFVTFFVMLFQFLAELIFKKPNEHLQHFGNTLGQYSCAIVHFITGVTEEMPFPFKAWPKADNHNKHK